MQQPLTSSGSNSGTAGSDIFSRWIFAVCSVISIERKKKEKIVEQCPSSK
jgi:hypothetical protein